MWNYWRNNALVRLDLIVYASLKKPLPMLPACTDFDDSQGCGLKRDNIVNQSHVCGKGSGNGVDYFYDGGGGDDDVI